MVNIATIYQVPSQEKTEYSQLFHHTSVADAMEILKSKKVYGTDRGNHANFFASRKFKNRNLEIPRSTEVCLEFEWSGSQLVLDLLPVDEPTNTGMIKPILYHIINHNPKDIENWAIEDHGYWQSIVYPGSNLLKLKDWSYGKCLIIPENKAGLMCRLFGIEPKKTVEQMYIANFEALAIELRKQQALFQT